jgi:hypothetical protein
MKKIMYINQNLRYFFFLILAGCFTSCSKQDATYSDFLKNGEIVYNGKPEQLQVLSGNNRVQLQWYIVSDPKITKAKIFWNNPAQIDGKDPEPGERIGGRDSVEINIQRSSGTDSVKVLIDRLKEGIYTFDVFMYDNAGHSSVKSEVIGNVYGDTYQNSISNRPLNTALLDTTESKSDVYLEWFGVAQQAVKIDLKYTDVSGTSKTVHMQKVVNPIDPRRDMLWETLDTLWNYKEGELFTYRTAYLPEPNSIDTFYTDFVEVSNIGYFIPPPPPTVSSNLALGTKVTASSSATQALTDGDRSNAAKWQPNSGERADLNVWFYVDLGESMDINKTQVYFTKDPGKITYYEILYTTEATIGSSTKWTRAFIKLESPDAEDINTFNTVKARYVKVNIGLKDSGTNINVSELEVYNE